MSAERTRTYSWSDPFELVADLAGLSGLEVMAGVRERLSVLLFAALLVGAIVGLAFALGYAVGKVLL